MYQQQNYYQQNRPQQQMFLKGRPVASLEEVKAAPIDFDGSIFYFPDLAQGKIYTKQINFDGTASLNMYEIKEIPKQEEKEKSYITREEFESAIQMIQNELQQSKPAEKTPQINF